MKHGRKIAILNYVSAACFYTAAIIGFLDNKSFAVIYLCLGSASLCLGSANLIRFRKENSQKDEEKDEK